MEFSIDVPLQSGEERIKIAVGSSLVFVGANGSGKTRLATFIENTLKLNAHRISAHRALTLNPAVPKISENRALGGLRTGRANDKVEVAYRDTQRWGSKGSVHLLNDFDFVVQALFAEQANKSLETHKKVRGGNNGPAEPTKFEVLTDVWERLLPHRKLYISGDDISVAVTGQADRYSGSEMSDGERAVFYILGQVLVAAHTSLIIFDEPELHVHRSIMAKLWDEIESIRTDCAFVFITHDLEFASSRVAKKYVLREYNAKPYWNLERLPVDTGFDEELTTLVLGSRKPILFVEGTGASLDLAIYRSCFPEWTVVPKGSCEDVIHSVVTMRSNASFTRVTCSGIVDSDDYHQTDKDYLLALGIATLPVSEVENIFLLPSVARVIASNEGHSGEELIEKIDALENAVFESIGSESAIEKVVVRHCKRRIDRALKKIDLGEAATTDELNIQYQEKTSSLDIESISQEAKNRIVLAEDTRDLPLLLASYDNKGLLALAACHLKGCRRSSFESWIVRVLGSESVPSLKDAIQAILPDATSQ